MASRWVVSAAIVALPALLLAAGPSANSGSGEVHFTAAGDISSSANAAAVLSEIHTLGSDLTIIPGDLSYGAVGQEQAWCDFVTSRVGAGYPFQLVAGNHESNGVNGNINEFAACLPNQLPGAIGTYGRQYYVDVPKQDPIVRFIQISPGLTFNDGAYSYSAGTPRYAWTEAAIDGARAAGVPWVVVTMHKPCLTVGKYTCESGSDLFDLLLSKKVDLVLYGHEHTYQRTKQLSTGNGCPTLSPGTYNASCVADDDSDYDQGRGTVFAVVGTGGNSLYNVNSGDSESGYFAATSGANKQPTWGPLDVTATADRLDATFVPVAGGSFSDAFSIAKSANANHPPTASFESSCIQASCTFDGSGSGDDDGTVASYAWDFGDGQVGTGETATHSYATSRTYQVKLTVTDDKGAAATTTRPVDITAPNTPPTASFTSIADGLSVQFDGSGSSDPDGTISSYAWDLGDGTTSTAKNPQHTYDAPGRYGVTLTVTDGEEATGSTTRDITVTAEPSAVALDEFERSVSNGWGTATKGGAWTVSPSSAFSVGDGTGRIAVTAGKAPSSFLLGTSLEQSDVNVSFQLDKAPTGSGFNFGVVPRRTSGGLYQAITRIQSNGTMTLQLNRAGGGGEAVLQGATSIPGGPYRAGDVFHARVQAVGTFPTTLRAKVWRDGSNEPTAWLRSVSDSSGPQATGSVGLLLYLSSSASNSPITASVDGLNVLIP